MNRNPKTQTLSPLEEKEAQPKPQLRQPQQEPTENLEEGPAVRKGMSKKLRFQVFSRDGFKCRYCGRTSDEIRLEPDHIKPVSKGGGNDLDNLITACFDCNRGKSALLLQQAPPIDYLRMAQERQEQAQAYEAAVAMAEARERLADALTDIWCEQTGRERIEIATFNVMMRYTEDLGLATVIPWIVKAAARFRYSDSKMGRYISGCRKNHIAGETDQ